MQNFMFKTKMDKIIKRGKIYTIGNSMTKHITRFSILIKNNAFVCSHSGETTEDLIDYTKPSIFKNAEVTIADIGSNDLTKIAKTTKKVKKTDVESIKELDSDESRLDSQVL